MQGYTPEEFKEQKERLRYSTAEWYPPTYHGTDGEVYLCMDTGSTFQYFTGKWYHIGGNKLNFDKIDKKKIKGYIYEDLRPIRKELQHE